MVIRPCAIAEAGASAIAITDDERLSRCVPLRAYLKMGRSEPQCCGFVMSPASVTVGRVSERTLTTGNNYNIDGRVVSKVAREQR